ncbi:MAG: yveA 2 [Gammaproteobacteria bacterium]|jgi:amino acid transporter|nr:yveA 2 [Gammaproteobacteria bacterium]
MLSRRFSPLHMLFLSINGIIGSAWLFAPLYSAKIAGSAVLLSWLIGGAATVLIAFTFAELSSLLPTAGGTTRFAELTHGATTGFIISWASWLSCVTMPPIEVQAVLQYISTYIPSLVITSDNHMPVLSGFGLMWAVILMLGLTFLNIASFKGFIRANFLIFSFKVLVIILTIAMLITTKFHPQNFTFSASSASSLNWQAILSAVATGGIAFAFTGFKHGVELAGEMTKPKLSIPLAIVGSVIICLILYVGLQIAFIGALEPSELTHGWANLHFSGDVGPFVGIAASLGIFWLVKLLLVDAAVSPLGAGLIYVTSTARIIYAMSRNHYLSPFFSELSEQKMPLFAIWFNFAVGILLFLPLPGWQNMVSFLVSAVVISYAMGPIATVALRKQLPNIKRSFRLPFNTLLCFVAFYCCNLISYWTGWDTLWKLAIALIVGSFLFITNSRFRLSNPTVGFKSLWWLIPYLAGLVILSYLGEYGGGHHIITFGWDFLIIAIFSLIIFSIAIQTRLPSHIVEKEFAQLQLETNAE